METIIHVDLEKNLSIDYINCVKQAYKIDSTMDACFHKNPNNEAYLIKLHNLGERKFQNLDKFVICVSKEVQGYIKYHMEDECVIESLWGKSEELISKMLKEFKKAKYHFSDDVMCNYRLDNILKKESEIITVEDFKSNPELLEHLNKEQLKEISYRMKNENNDDLKTDNSLNNITFEDKSGGENYGYQKVLSNGHSVIETDSKKQGYVDALVLSLLSGFASGVLFTLVILYIKLKTGM